MATYRVDELEGVRLDFAVARIVRGDAETNRQFDFWLREVWEAGAQRYSTDWLLAGPIIERERIMICPGTNEQPFHDCWTACYQDEDGIFPESLESEGPTPLVAAMRALLKKKAGEEIEL